MRGLIVLVLLASAGCVAPAAVSPVSLEAPPVLSAVFDIDHDHEDPALHAMTWNATLLAHAHPELDGLGWLEMNELDLMGDLLLVGVNAGKPGEEASEGGFLVFDVSDPTAPALLHYERSPDAASCIGDVKAGPGEAQVTLATQCARDASRGHGFVVYDLADPAAPRVLALAPEGTSCHMVDTSVVGGVSYVYCASAVGAAVFRLTETPLGLQAVLVNPNLPLEPTSARHLPLAMSEFGTAGPLFMVFPHDMTTQPDPLTGEPIVVVSHSYSGIRILDGRDPALGRVLGTWSGEGASSYSWIHTAHAVVMDGRRIVVGITENVVNTPPRFWVVDFTDYANPVLLAEHDLAAQADSHDLVYSLHNFQVVGTRMYVAAYHGGVWALDLADPTAPREVGFALSGQPVYVKPEGTFWGIGNNWAEQVWDVVVKDGYVFASDMASGLHVYAFEGAALGDASQRSFG
ncbi:MAG TPA: hypothetical protein VFH78_07385 [Candidatus Thermoplasmatota archaeon]|nr:hypothetical protein [Candidatus Thermoplasmatota archaeon]